MKPIYAYVICIDVDLFISSLVLFKTHSKGHLAIEDYGGRDAYINQEEEPQKEGIYFV